MSGPIGHTQVGLARFECLRRRNETGLKKGSVEHDVNAIAGRIFKAARVEQGA